MSKAEPTSDEMSSGPTVDRGEFVCAECGAELQSMGELREHNRAVHNR